MPRVVQTARDKPHEMHFWERLIEEDGLSVLLCDNREHNHFILKVCIGFHNGCLHKMGAKARDKSQTRRGKDKRVGRLYKTVPERGQNQICCANKC